MLLFITIRVVCIKIKNSRCFLNFGRKQKKETSVTFLLRDQMASITARARHYLQLVGERIVITLSLPLGGGKSESSGC